jgi:DNA-binding transcriptional MerR regulator
MDELLSIGRFGRLSGLSIAALRHYDELGLLRPATVDPQTGYRRYAAGQLEAARLIRDLRDLDLPLAEIRRLMSGGGSVERAAVLERHRLRLEARLARAGRDLHRTRRLLEGDTTMPSDTTVAIDPGERRQLAATLFNHVWTLLEKEDRTAAEIDEMIHAAHASRYHWGEVGGPEHRARGEWQCSRVYAVLGRGEPAIWHARRCLEICEEHGIGDWDIAFAHEALARAYRTAGDDRRSAEHLAAAREAALAVRDSEDRELLEADLATIG